MSEGNKTITLTQAQVATLIRAIEIIEELSNWTPSSQDRLTEIWEQLVDPTPNKNNSEVNNK